MQQLFRNSAATLSFGRGIGSTLPTPCNLRGGDYVPDHQAITDLSGHDSNRVNATPMGFAASANQSIMFHR